MRLIFCMQINIKVSWKLISTLWASKFFTRQYCHYWWVWSSILKVFKVTSLQSLYNISKNKLGMEVIFWHADKRQSFYQLALSFLMEVARHVQSTYSRILVIFLQYVKRKYHNCFCVLLWCKTFRYFMGVQSCSLLLVCLVFDMKVQNLFSWNFLV